MTAITADSEVDVCNMALSHLGVSNGIQSFTDQTEQAKACAFWYPRCRDQLLKSAPWDFAYTYLALASDASNLPGTLFAYPGWSFAYQFPNDCLQAVAVVTAYGERAGRAYWYSHWGYPTGPAFPKIPYKIAQSTSIAGQKVVLCDLPAPMYLFYIQCVTDTSMFDAMFTDALSFRIGWRIGGVLRGANSGKIQYCQSMSESLRLQALAQCMNQAQQDPERQSPSVLARM
jgi:hypothetical protein